MIDKSKLTIERLKMAECYGVFDGCVCYGQIMDEPIKDGIVFIHNYPGSPHTEGPTSRMFFNQNIKNGGRPPSTTNLIHRYTWAFHIVTNKGNVLTDRISVIPNYEFHIRKLYDNGFTIATIVLNHGIKTIIRNSKLNIIAQSGIERSYNASFAFAYIDLIDLLEKNNKDLISQLKKQK